MNKKHIISYSAAVLLALSNIVPAAAQRRVSLDECLRIATENNLIMKSAGIAVERAKAMQGTAFDVEKTGVTLGQDPTGGGSPDNALTFSQTFSFPTVYGAKHKLLKEETELERKRQEMTRNELMRSVSAEYCNLLYTIERQHILTRQAAIYKRFRFLADAKLKYGETGKLEQMNAARLNRENEIALQNIGRDVETARLRLQQLLNTTETLTPAEDSLVVIGDQDAALGDYNPEATPLGQMLAQRQRVSEQNIKVERQSFLPDISIAASTQFLLKGWNPYNVDRSRFDKGNFMGFEVGVSVPLFFGAQRARLKSARHDAELARTEAEEQLLQLRSRHAEAQNDLRKAQANLDYYTTQGIPQADKLERISQVSYEKGAIGYVEYIQNLQTAVDIRNAYATAVNEYNQAAISIKYSPSPTQR